MKKSVLFFCAALGALAFLPTKSDADWTRSNGPWSATVMDILADGSNLFCATRGGGVLLSTDNGSSWTPLDNGLTNPYVNRWVFPAQVFSPEPPLFMAALAVVSSVQRTTV